MPTRGSIIRPFAERFLIAHGIAELPVEIETVSDSFGRAFVRQTDAIWIISEGVVAADIAAAPCWNAARRHDGHEGSRSAFTMRTDTVASPAFSILLQTIRDATQQKA